MRDQQIGGLLLWIPGSMMSVIGAVLALRHWMRLSARARLRDERHTHVPTSAGTQIVAHADR
jgi:putative membrane protein